MKIVQLSTCVTASSAYVRLQAALQKCGVESLILTRQHDESVENAYDIRRSVSYKIKEKIWGNEWQKRLSVYDLPSNMPFSISVVGEDLADAEEIKQADIIHLHWICGFLSPQTIRKLCGLGKPVVWTCHDSWPFTGGCHVRYGCDKYRSECGSCPMIYSENPYDITRKIFHNKQKYFSNTDITFIAPSHWMKENIEVSSLFHTCRCEVIPNTIDLDIFARKDKSFIISRLKYKKDESKIHVLFGAVSIDIPYKGFSYLIKFLTRLYECRRDIASKIVLHFIGREKSEEDILKKYECITWGYVSDQEKIACIYSLADIFVFPTLDDNLPGMVMESLACEVPVVSFRTGGVTDMLVHKRNGYAARYKDIDDLLEGFLWVISNNKGNLLGKNGREKICKDFSPSKIAAEHIRLYRSLLRGEGNV